MRQRKQLVQRTWGRTAPGVLGEQRESKGHCPCPPAALTSPHRGPRQAPCPWGQLSHLRIGCPGTESLALLARALPLPRTVEPSAHLPCQPHFTFWDQELCPCPHLAPPAPKHPGSCPLRCPSILHLRGQSQEAGPSLGLPREVRSTQQERSPHPVDPVLSSPFGPQTQQPVQALPGDGGDPSSRPAVAQRAPALRVLCGGWEQGARSEGLPDTPHHSLPVPSRSPCLSVTVPCAAHWCRT